MASLGAHQKISRVITGLPWGDGATGAGGTITSDPNTRATASGSASSTSLTAGTTGFANGDLVMIHQTQGTGVGQWEINKVASGGGTTSLTMQVALQYTYGTGAQIIKIPRYTTVTLGAITPTAWNGSTGGITVIAAKTSIATSGTFSGSGLGYRGGAQNGSNGATQGGEGGAGYGNTTYGAAASTSGHGGSGGGYGSAGNVAPSGSAAGAAYGSTDLTVFTMGGSGGGASGGSGAGAEGAGGGSGHALVLISKAITISNAITLTGQKGFNGSDRGGGGGSGGACLIVCDTVSGVNNITATGGALGTGVDANANGAAGGNGRIAVHYATSVTGTSSPASTNTQDVTLVEIAGGGGLLTMFVG